MELVLELDRVEMMQLENEMQNFLKISIKQSIQLEKKELLVSSLLNTLVSTHLCN